MEDHVTHDVDVCVVGGGMAGLCAAVSAARHGARAALMQDRPVLGGNASGECRVHICGADRHNRIPFMRETGILEEIRMDNLRRNPNRSFAIWDTILYEKARFEPNVTLLLNCSCNQAEMEGNRIASVTGWQLTTYTHQTVRARVFIDCSGDGVLAPLTGAQFRVGREAASEYGESIAPQHADRKTMGMTLLFFARQHPTPQPFTPPSWAYSFPREEDIPGGAASHKWLQMGYWWVELGGEHDSIRDSEKLRDELLKVVYGLWDHIKNHCVHKEAAANWAIDWLQFLPAKRESRRYVGDHVLTQNDIESGGRFDDVVAYGGWEMDDHDPAGFWSARRGKPPTIFHKAPSPYGIPYRCLYSRNVENLMFAGRCASATHAAMSSTRVMGTGSVMGQAAGTAAAMAARLSADPRDIASHIEQLQQMLLRDDCYLPAVVQQYGGLTATAELSASQGDGEPLRDGVNRRVGRDTHSWTCRVGDWAQYRFAGPRQVAQATLIVDSALDKDPQMSYHRPVREADLTAPPPVMPRSFRIQGLSGGAWMDVVSVQDNHQRLVRLPIQQELDGVRFVLDGTWGAVESSLYAFYLD